MSVRSAARLAQTQQVEPTDAEPHEEEAQQVTHHPAAVRRGDDEQRDPDPQEGEREKRRCASVEIQAAAAFRPATTITRQGAFLRM